MSQDAALVGVAGALAGAAAALWLGVLLMKRRPKDLVRTNYRGLEIAAVLGFAVTGGGMAGLGVAALTATFLNTSLGNVGWAVLAILVLLGAGGAADDLKGDERAKGFSGHLKAAVRGRITGGFMKIIAGGAAGLVAGFLVHSGRAAVETAFLIALTANLLNLFDRAPGRSTKVALAGAVPLLLVGSAPWALSSAGLWGAAAAMLPPDLRERAMLGDTGANPMGGVLGLGLGVSLDEPGRLLALGVVFALNAASERWSFSQVIEGNRLLRSIDRSGRTRS